VHAGRSAHVHLVDTHRAKDQFWGTTELVGLLHRVAARMAREHPGAKLTLGELSKAGGGAIVGHRSHESGRDADIGFYLRDDSRALVRPPHLVRVWRNGTGHVGERQLTFDDAMNWRLFELLVTDSEVPVQHVFASRGVRARLLAHARQIGVSQDLYERAQRLMRQPGAGPRAHAEHFHVRIYCVPRDREVCRDRGPYWPWIPASHTPLWAAAD
jgi:penicillin-insensitive murein endopeptidase